MKKLFILISTIVTVLALSGCDLINASEIVIALNNMDRLDSYKMDISVEIDGEELMSSYMYVVEDYQEMHILGETEGTFIIDDTFYVLEQWYGFNKLVELTDIEDDDYDNFNLFEAYEFIEDEDGYFVLEGESDLFEGVQTIKFLIEDKKIKEMILEGEMDLLGETFAMDIIIEYSKYNEVEIDVPTYLTDNEIAVLEEYIDAFNVYDIITGENGFSINGHLVIDCLGETCFIEADPGLDYNPETQEVSVQEESNWVPYLDYVEANPSETITVEFFEFVHYVDELCQKYK